MRYISFIFTGDVTVTQILMCWRLDGINISTHVNLHETLFKYSIRASRIIKPRTISILNLIKYTQWGQFYERYFWESWTQSLCPILFRFTACKKHAKQKFDHFNFENVFRFYIRRMLYAYNNFWYSITLSCYFVWRVFIMTSSNGNIFRVTGPLCGKFTGHRWIPLTKASYAEL